MANTQRSITAAAVVAGIVASGLGATVVLGQTATSVQTAQGAFAEVLSAVSRLNLAVSAVQASVDGVQRALDGTAGLEGAVLHTTAVHLPAGLASCTALNVSATAKIMRVELFRTSIVDNTRLIELERSVEPGRSFGVRVFAEQLGGGSVRCELTAVDGTKADIRGGLILQSTDTSTPTAVLTAD